MNHESRLSDEKIHAKSWTFKKDKTRKRTAVRDYNSWQGASLPLSARSEKGKAVGTNPGNA